MRLIDADKMRENLVWCKSQSSSYNDYWDDVIERLDAQPTVSGWVSVKDRLPEHGKRYLIYATSGDNKIGHITTAAFGGHFALSGRCAYWKVTHWMPLTQPPEDEDV